MNTETIVKRNIGEFLEYREKNKQLVQEIEDNKASMRDLARQIVELKEEPTCK
ncbi:hypothetical protein [Alkalibaculum sporogenes]|uniref:hypothetical protein n=1 Tax=Alkalibaculum sporogenes TaxID=2655001 RepID=UPI00187BA99D|nr:hypothetical protein [Alkalibaculum sporogenes]